MRKNNFLSGLSSCSAFALFPVVSSGVTNSTFSFSVSFAFLCLVMYLSYVGHSKGNVFIVGIVYLFSFSRISRKLCLGSFELLSQFVGIDKIVRIASFVAVFFLIVSGLSMFCKWVMLKRRFSSDKIHLPLAAFLGEEVLASKEKITFVLFLKNLFFLVFVPYVIAYFIGLLSFGSSQNVEVAQNFLEVARIEGLESAHLKLAVYMISYTMPLVVVWFLIMLIRSNKGFASRLRKHFDLIVLIFSAVLLSVGFGFGLLFYNKVL